MSNLLNQPLPHGDFVATVDKSIERLEVQLGELRAALRGYFAGVERAVESHSERDLQHDRASSAATAR